MSRTVSLIAKLSQVDEDVARRAWTTAQAQDDVSAPPPAEFATGRGARCYALSLYASRKPVHFYLGLLGLGLFPAYLLVRFLVSVYGR